MKKNPYQEHIEAFNSQFSTPPLQQKNLVIPERSGKPDGIVIIGMGGSGLAGDLLLGLKEEVKLKVSVILWKNFGLPKTHFKKPLFVFISYSGNTEETLSGLRQIINKRAAGKTLAAVITTGGKLKAIAEKNKIPFVSFSGGQLTPREAIGYTFYALLLLLKSYFPEVSILSSIPKHIHPSIFKKDGERIAKFLHSSISLVYTENEYSHVGYAWKANLNEAGKHQTFTNTMPEMFHNEIASFEKNRFPLTAIFLVSPNSGKKALKKIALAQKLMRPERIPTKTIILKGKNKTERTWNAIILSHWASFYLAKMKHINPATTPIIEKLKKGS